MVDFINDFMEFSKESESPRSYWFWSALASISAVTKRNVWIQRPTWKTYPNVFIFLIGESGLRKGIPIALAKDLVGSVNNTRLISGRSSVQGIISALGTVYTLPDGSIIDKAYAFISASEFASSLVRDPDSLTILTDLYDSCYHDKWADTLRSGKVELIEPSITLLAGINPPHFEDFISATQVEGGFVGRLLLIFENEKACINPAIRKKEKPRDWKELIKPLREISKVKGEMILEEKAIEFYEHWYTDFEQNRRDKKLKDRTGAINRIGENVLKVAILFALARAPSLLIKLEDVENALNVCVNSLSNVNKTTAGQGKAQYAPQTKAVLNELIAASNHEISRKRLLQNNYGTLDAVDLDRVIDSLIQAGGVEQETRGGKIYYKLTPMAVKQLGALDWK